MMQIDELYAMQNYLNNVLMFKYIYDAGIELTPFSNCRLPSYDGYGDMDEESFNNFATVADYLFDCVSFYFYDEDEDVDQKNKEYWLQLANAPEIAEKSLMVAVILDSTLRNSVTGSVGMCYHTGECAEAYQIDDGVIIVYDTYYGNVDWCEIMCSLLQSRQTHLIKEEQQYEMAI